MSLLLSYAKKELSTLSLGRPDFLFSILIHGLLKNICTLGNTGGVLSSSPSLCSLQNSASNARYRSRSIPLFGGSVSSDLEQGRRESMAFALPQIMLPLCQPPSDTLVSCADFNSKAAGGHGAANWC